MASVVERMQAAFFAGEATQAAVAAELQAAMGETCTAVRDLVQAMPHWRLWPGQVASAP